MTLNINFNICEIKHVIQSELTAFSVVYMIVIRLTFIVLQPNISFSLSKETNCFNRLRLVEIQQTVLCY